MGAIALPQELPRPKPIKGQSEGPTKQAILSRFSNTKRVSRSWCKKLPSINVTIRDILTFIFPNVMLVLAILD